MRMCVSLVAAILTCGTALAQDDQGAKSATGIENVGTESPVRTGGNFGIGLQNGVYSNAVSAKYFLSDRTAIQGAVGGYGLVGRWGWASLDAAFLFEQPFFVTERIFDIGWYIGPGASVGVGRLGSFVGVHPVVGVEMVFRNFPVDITLQYAPGLMFGSVGRGVWIDPYNVMAQGRFYF